MKLLTGFLAGFAIALILLTVWFTRPRQCDPLDVLGGRVQEYFECVRTVRNK